MNESPPTASSSQYPCSSLPQSSAPLVPTYSLCSSRKSQITCAACHPVPYLLAPIRFRISCVSFSLPNTVYSERTSFARLLAQHVDFLIFLTQYIDFISCVI